MKALIIILLGFTGLVGSPALARAVNGTISAQGDTVHLELVGEQNWDYDVQKNQKKNQSVVEMTVNPLDDATVKALTTFKSDLVSSVSVDKNGPDGKYLVSFNVVSDEVESFDYLTDQPSRLIVDFYVSNNNREKFEAKKGAGASLPEKKVAASKITKLPKKLTAADKNGQRKPATADALVISDQGSAVAQNDGATRFGIFDGGDPNYERFSVKDYETKEDPVILSKENYYIPFPMMQSPAEAWDKIKAAPAVYEIAPKDTDENKQARLLLTLFEKQRYAVFLKTVDWFKQKYPESGYNEMIDYMKADTHLTQWQEKGHASDYDQAVQEYKEAVKKYPQSPLAERTSLKLGYLALEKGDALDAIRLFKEHIENKNFDKKESFSKDLARIGTGMAFAKLNRYDEASDEFTNVEKTSSFKDLKIEAAFRRGDVNVQARKFTQAIEEYRKSLKKYPEAQNQYPNAYYNQAEALFSMDKFRDSMDMYREFVKKFPSSEHAPFAMTRLGELMDVLGADKSRVIGAYLETYFRYGENPSAIIARLRLLSARMKGMKPKEVESAVTEIMTLAKKLDLPNIEQFATVMVADGFTRRGENQKAIDLLTKYYQQNPTSVDRNLVTRRIVSNISDQIRNEVDQGQFIQALKSHQKYEDNWLKNANRLDIKYDLGRSFEMAGVPKEAEKYDREVLNKIYAMKGTQEDKQIAVSQKLPSTDELNLRLASLMSQEQKFSQSYDYLKDIKNPEKLTEEQQIERVDLAVKLLEKRGDIDSAIRYLTELLTTWKGQPALVAGPYLKLSELQIKQNKTDDAVKSLVKVDELMKDSDKVPQDIHMKSLENLADLYLQKNMQEKAAATLQRLLDTYEEKKPLASLRYKLGDIYFKRGEVQKAAEVWNDIKGKKSEFWKSLAQEQLKNSEWRGSYKKYIKRIPAMNESN